ncbi:MAG: L-rhamnose mutarotase [Cytophagales bacterium]|nr:L-rhamnose mutarotase [Bernardetiaceae bacterium]MDW8211797.1 L-rhamnose mutarotase [Cytophagales bacterium]
MKRYALTLDLQDDPALIAEYERYHQQVPEAVLQSIRQAGILQMYIYRLGTRLFMLIETEDEFSFERKAHMDAQNPDVQAWEELMSNFQKPLPQAQQGEKWLVMKQIFVLKPEKL